MKFDDYIDDYIDIMCFLNEFCQHVFFQCVLNNEVYLKRAKFTLLVITTTIFSSSRTLCWVDDFSSG